MIFNPLYKKAYEYSWEGTRNPYTMKSSKEKFERFDELTRNQLNPTKYFSNTTQGFNANQSRQSSSPDRMMHSAGFNSTFSQASTFSKKNQLLLPVTNGLSNNQLFQRASVKPKLLAPKGGQLSNDFGCIPDLRSPPVKVKRMSKHKYRG